MIQRRSVIKLQLRAEVFRRTGGTHAAALFTSDGELQALMEDVGRHNAVDKAIGAGVLRGLDFGRCFLFSTGRLSADMVIKCARAGIPLVASKSAPFSRGSRRRTSAGLPWWAS